MPLDNATRARIEQAEHHYQQGMVILKNLHNGAQGETREQLQRAIYSLELSDTPYERVMQHVHTVNKKAVDNAPHFLSTHVVELDKDDRGLERSIVRMNTSRMDQSRQNKAAFFRRQPVKIYNPLTGLSIIRMPMGGGGLKGLSRDSIALDYDAIDALGIKGNFKNGPLDVELVVSRAKAFSIYRYYWNYPEVGYKLAMRISMLGFILGFAGFLPMLLGGF